MTTVHFMTGYPGSGKTTVAKQLVAESGGTLKRVSLDDFRTMTNNYVMDDANERLVSKLQDRAVVAAVDAGFDVVIDNTHLHKRIPSRILTALATRDVTFRVHSMLDVPVEECILRDAQRRLRGEKSVGKDVIERMVRRRTSWTLTERWLAAEHLTVEPYEPDPELSLAVVVDLDGTLALHDGRSPYDTARCGEDLLHLPLSIIVEDFYRRGIQPILLSGRGEEFRAETEDWLQRNQVLYRHLFMRKRGDRRRDDIVKYELFNEHLRDHYNVIMAFDDRDRVVRLWRAVGIMTAQMNWGDF